MSRDCDNCAFYDEDRDNQPCCYCTGECFEPAEELEEIEEAEGKDERKAD